MWLEGSIASTAVGKGIEFFDIELVKNGHWTIHDAVAGISPGNLVLNGDFALGNASWTVGANWSTATGKCVHTAVGGATQAVTQAITLKIGYYYDIVVTVAGMTAGTLTLSATNTTGGPLVISANGTYTLRVLDTGAACVLTFTPTATFDGNFDDVSLNQVLTNCKVYKCTDDVVNCTFYLKVDDEHIGFSILELWEGWNAGTHVGTGLSRTVFGSVSTFRWNRPIGPYKISLHDHWFIFINVDYCGYWCGRPSLYDVTKNIVMIAADGPSNTGNNFLANYTNNQTGGWSLLFDETGASNNAVGGQGGLVSYGQYRYTKGIDGKYHVAEEVIANWGTGLLVGTLTGVISTGDRANGLANNDIVTIDGIDWIACGGGGYWVLVRKD
jgi:hypothetical protein